MTTSTKTIRTANGPVSVSVLDENVQFEGGPVVRRRTFLFADGHSQVVVEPPCGEIEPGRRVRSMDDNCGIGLVDTVDGDHGPSALFPTSLGAEFNSSLEEGYRVLPDGIEASVQLADGAWVALDITEAVLELDRDGIITLSDEQVPAFVSRLLPNQQVKQAEFSAAIARFFGLLPGCTEDRLAAPEEISGADIEQSRALHRMLSRQRELESPAPVV